MKVAVLNLSGNVGKTVVANMLLTPRIPGMAGKQAYEFDLTNSGGEQNGADVMKVSAKSFMNVIGDIMLEDDAVLDIGASQVETVLLALQEYNNSHEEIDYFVVPVTADIKIQNDTVRTINALKALGVPKERILLLPNKCDNQKNALPIEEVFQFFHGLSIAEDSFVLNFDAAIYYNDFFEKVKGMDTTLAQMLADDTDYRALRKSAHKAGDSEASFKYLRLHELQGLAPGVNAHLDSVFKSLFQ